MYRNAYGRSAQLSELSGWLSQLNAGTATRATIVQALADSAEHLADGNTHTVTNNSNSGRSTVGYDHTTDKTVAAQNVDRLYVTALNRHATSSDPASYAANILNGTASETTVANSLIGSSEFQKDYGSLSDTQFVNQMYQNGLGRAPTAQESSTWVGLLGTTGPNKMTRADLVIAIADSPDHLAVANSGSQSHAMAQQMTATSSSSATTPSAASQSQNAASSSSINQMIQAMATMTASPSSSSSVAAAQPAHSDHHLAAAHH